MKTLVIKRFLENRQLLDFSEPMTLAKLRRHWSLVLWTTVVIVIFGAPVLFATTIGWFGWILLLLFPTGAAVHELYTTWRIKRLFEQGRAPSLAQADPVESRSGRKPAFDGEGVTQVLAWLGGLCLVAGLVFFGKFVVQQLLN